SLLDEAAGYIAGLGTESRVRGAITQSFRSVPALLAFTNDVASAMVDPGAPAGVAFRYADTDRFPIGPDRTGDAEASVLGLVVGDDADACARGVAQEIATLLERATVTDRETGGPRRVR